MKIQQRNFRLSISFQEKEYFQEKHIFFFETISRGDLCIKMVDKEREKKNQHKQWQMLKVSFRR